MIASNYPPGVTGAHPYFNPPACGNCGEDAVDGEDCEFCGEYVSSWRAGEDDPCAWVEFPAQGDER
jgi:hypothetical protein